MNHVSNAFGFILPVEGIAALCRERGIPFVLDAIITFILSRMKVEEANDKIRAEMKN